MFTLRRSPLSCTLVSPSIQSTPPPAGLPRHEPDHHAASPSIVHAHTPITGTSGFLAYLAFRIVFPLLHLGWVRKAILQGVSKQEFHALCHTHEKQIQICSWLLDTMLPCFALFAGVPRRQMNLGNGRENFSVIVNHVLFNTDMVHDNYFYLGKLVTSMASLWSPFFHALNLLSGPSIYNRLHPRRVHGRMLPTLS